MHGAERVKMLTRFKNTFPVIQNVMNKKNLEVYCYSYYFDWMENVTQATWKPSQHSLSHCKDRASFKLTFTCSMSKIEILEKGLKYVKP